MLVAVYHTTSSSATSSSERSVINRMAGKFISVDVLQVDRFKGTLIRLFSMLHALALAELEVINTNAEQISEVGP